MAKWWEAPDVGQKAAIAKEKTWTNFLKYFPKADKSWFVSEAHFDDKLNATAEVFFKESKGSLKSIFDLYRQNWSAEMKQALGLGDSGAKWWEAPDVGQKAAIAKEKAWTSFLKYFTKADKSRFVSEAHFDDKLNATTEVFFKESEGSLKSVFDLYRQNWSAERKQALGLGDSGGVPYQLSPLGSKVSLPIVRTTIFIFNK